MDITTRDLTRARDVARMMKRKDSGRSLLNTDDVVQSALRQLLEDEDASGVGKPFRLDHFGMKVRRVLIQKHRLRERLCTGANETFVELSANMPQTEDQNGPAARFECREYLDAAVTALERVNARDAEVLHLTYFESLKQKEIAACTGQSLRLVQEKKSRGLAWLRGYLTRGTDKAWSDA